MKTNWCVALIGSPNSGKTTLFNALTGSHQKTANYAGVTVEKKEGHWLVEPDQSILIYDLPGAYSLDPKSPDEQITSEVVLNQRSSEINPNFVIAVADSNNLERNLYLVMQLKELKIPFVLALTMSDLAKKQKTQIAVKMLAEELQVPVVEISAITRSGLSELKNTVLNFAANLKTTSLRAETIALAQGNEAILKRYAQIESLLKKGIYQQTPQDILTKKIDKLVLNKFFGPLLLLVLMLIMFQLIFSLARIPMEAITNSIEWMQGQLNNTALPLAVKSLLSEGVLAGVGSVIVFLPQILLLYFCIIVLEDSGYMARAAFILDRLMSRFGLHGRAFIPLLSSFACAVPGIMATRTIDSKKDRLITILIAPLMTCSARIPVYSLLIATFFADKTIASVFNLRGLVMAGFYLLAVVMGFLVALVLQKLLRQTQPAPFILELPSYKLPSLKNLYLTLFDRAQVFLKKAGSIILLASIILWVLASFPKATPLQTLSEQDLRSYQLEHSWAGSLGKAIEPVIHPLGFDWKIGIGLISSLAAREVILSTLSTVYAIEDNKEDHRLLSEKIKNDPHMNFAVAISLLVFFAFACQCMSTLAITKRETNSWRWPIVMFSYMSILAYSASWISYRLMQLFMTKF